MKKIFSILLMVFILISTYLPVKASEAPIIFKDSITVTEDGGRYQVGFVNVEFKKDFLEKDMLPATFDVEVYAENGTVYVEFAPDTPLFFKQVHIRVDAFEGFIYDKATKENIYVSIDKHQVLAPHFSRYAVNG